MDDWTALTTVERVIELHAAGINAHGQGALDPPRPDCVEGALGSAWLAEYYTAQPNRVEGFAFAAHAYVYLESRQCFSNGNKRAAWATMMDVLNSIGIEIECSDVDAERICLDIAEKRTTVEGLLSWIVEHATDMDAE